VLRAEAPACSRKMSGTVSKPPVVHKDGGRGPHRQIPFLRDKPPLHCLEQTSRSSEEERAHLILDHCDEPRKHSKDGQVARVKKKGEKSRFSLTDVFLRTVSKKCTCWTSSRDTLQAKLRITKQENRAVPLRWAQEEKKRMEWRSTNLYHQTSNVQG